MGLFPEIMNGGVVPVNKSAAAIGLTIQEAFYKHWKAVHLLWPDDREADNDQLLFVASLLQTYTKAAATL